MSIKTLDTENIKLAQRYLESADGEITSLLDFAEANKHVGLVKGLQGIRNMIENAKDVLENGY